MAIMAAGTASNCHQCAGTKTRPRLYASLYEIRKCGELTRSDSEAVVTVRFLKCWSIAHAARNPWTPNITSQTSRLAPPRSQKSAYRVVNACLGAARSADSPAGTADWAGCSGNVETVIDTRLCSDNL